MSLLRVVKDTDELASEETYLRELARQYKADVRFLISADPAAAIIAELEKNPRAIAAMTTHGRTAWAEALVGSVAFRVIKGAKRPVIVYRPLIKDTDAPKKITTITQSGFVWTSDYVDSDFPYVISCNDKQIVSISYATPGYTDGELSSRGAVQGLAEIKYAFDATFEESKRHPMKFCYAIHPHVSGTVGMAQLLDDFLAHVRSRGNIWFPRYIDVAEFWLASMGK